MRRLMWFSIGFGAAALLGGYLLTRQMYLPAVVLACLLLCACLISMLKWKKMRIPAVAAFGLAVGLCWLFVFDEVYLSPLRQLDGQCGTVQITAMEDGQVTQYGSMVKGCTVLAGRPYTVTVYLNGEKTVSLGDVITGEFRVKSTLTDGSNPSSYNRGNGIFATLSGGKETQIVSPDHLPVQCIPMWIRCRLINLLDRLFPEDTAPFARALLLGDTSQLDYETDTALKISGIAHVVAVSGMHVTILFAMLYFFTGRRRLLIAVIGIPLLFLFGAIAGFGPSVKRACIMHGILVLGMLVDKEYDPPTALGFAVIVMLLLNPFTAVSVSFQLSVGCMVGIFLFAEPITTWLMDRKRLGCFKARKLMSGISASAGISLGASILTAPLCAIYFGTVSLVSLLTNLLTLWAVTYVFYGIMAVCLLGLTALPLGIAGAWIVSWGIRYILGVANLLAKFPFAAVYTESIFVVVWLVLSYGLLGLFFLMKKKRPAVLGLCSTLCLLVAITASWMAPMGQECRVTALDVGQGQCILLQSEGKNFLVDCGGDGDEATAEKAAQLLLSQGIFRLDGVIVTHYDRDHAGAMEMLLKRVPADMLYLPDVPEELETAHDLQAASEGGAVLVKKTQTVFFADATITIIPSQLTAADNESGLCVLFQTENCDILITGDRSHFGELELMQTVKLPQLELLIVGHHGAASSTSRALLEATRPKMAFISVGKDNSYGHPSEEVISLLEEFGCDYRITADNGTLIYRG